jgi:hypothetical protein
MRASLALVIGLFATLPACESTTSTVGQSETQAVYSMGSLQVELPPRFDVLTVTAAAEVTLRERGYTITHKSANADRAAFYGRAATVGAIPQADVVVSQTAGGTGLSLKVGVFGDEVASRVLMEAILAKLGL